jgi:hypothetical protein
MNPVTQTRKAPTVETVMAEHKRQAENAAAIQANLPTEVKQTTPLPAPTATPVTIIPDSARRYLDKNAGATVGKVVKLNGQTGKYTVGDGTEEMDLSAVYIAHCDQAQVGFVNFPEDGGQPRRAMVPLFSGVEPPERSSLGDNDPAQWPVSQFDSQARDPWVPQTVLVLQNAESNALFTLVASSISARNAVDNLLRQYSFFPGESPLVRLGVGKYLHKTRKTWIHYPDFRLVGRAKTAKPVQAEPAADFNDEVPV